ncbi:hypothetical protein KSW81_007689 [Nannochloris sp. 'desiccata']|nr:hypothetical protein KSW81_007689 [Chlorella desiccata (nom. nud.)]
MNSAQQGGSRLQKLLRLIDGGSSPETRRAAAEQIAAIVAAHPAQLTAVIQQVSRHLRHKEWDARVAAAHCLGKIADHVAHHTPATLALAAGINLESLAEAIRPETALSDENTNTATTSSLLSFDTFNVATVVQQGTPLLASAGNEYDLPAVRGGIFFSNNGGVEDTGAGVAATTTTAGNEGEPEQRKGATELLQDMSGMSARERAAALRKAKSARKRGPIGEGNSDGRAAKKSRTDNKVAQKQAESPQTDATCTEISEAAVAEEAEALDSQWQAILAGHWPFQFLCDQLCVDLLHPMWEVRHGAAIALREILSTQARSAGVIAPLEDPPGGWTAAGGTGRPQLIGSMAIAPAAAAAGAEIGVHKIDVVAAMKSNTSWLEDCAIHMLCTLALDRFGDYLSDQVVAPVRETTAQALGMVARAVPRPVLLRLLHALRMLAECSEWEARHGGLQGLKYVLAAQAEEVDTEILACALPSSVNGMRDRDDDVRAVAAEALLPTAKLLAHDTSPDAAMLLRLVWDALLATDELSPAVKGALSLLAAVYSSAEPGAACLEASSRDDDATNSRNTLPLCALLPRVFPHLRHNLSSVRISALRCLTALLATQPVATLLPQFTDLRLTLRLLFQNILIEKDADVLNYSQKAWETLMNQASQAQLTEAVSGGETATALVKLACTAQHKKFNAKLFVFPPSLSSLGGDDNALGLGDDDDDEGNALLLQFSSLVPGGEGEGQAERVTRMRLVAATCLGQLAHKLSPPSLGKEVREENPIIPCLVAALKSTSASARVLGGFAVAFWGQYLTKEETTPSSSSHSSSSSSGLDAVVGEALSVLTAPAIVFEEHVPSYNLLKRQITALIEIATSKGTPVAALSCPIENITPPTALNIVGPLLLLARGAPELPQPVKLAAEAVYGTAKSLQTNEAVLHATASSSLAAAVVHSSKTSKNLPAKLNSLIQPLIASVRREPDPLFQDQAAVTLAKLAVACISRTPSPTEKVVKNICNFACSDSGTVPSAAKPPVLGEEEVQQHQSGKTVAKKGEEARKIVAGAAATAAAAGADGGVDSAFAQASALTRRGGEAMLRALAIECGPSLPSLLPGLWNQHISKSIEDAAQAPQPAVEGLRTLEVLAPALHADVIQGVGLALLPGISQCLGHTNGAVQLSAARAIAALGAALPSVVMPRALDVISPQLVSTAAEAARLGAVVAMREIVHSLGLKMIPYVQLAVVPLLSRMSDPHPGTRAVASSCFAAVVALMPLAQGVPPPPGLSAEQEAMLEKEGKFLQQLLDNRQMEDFKLPFKLLTGTLRRYQQEGINWLAFLRRFGLHGVLADDMGLGKTLQATSIVAAATIEGKQKYATSGAALDAPRPSLIVCPATLVAHWPHEISKFVDETVLRPMQYHGVPVARAALRPLLSSHDVVVMSYEAVRADVDWVSSVDWMYCVLDEGHAVRNPASKVSQAVRRVKAQHRLILSGTPIQNSVIEMWALFDFLMPGFLGGERAFNSRYGRALAASRGAKRGSKEAEGGVLALDALHRQVMPFVLRRTKDQVLQDLPPKTVQDVICDPGELQRALYEDFATSQAMTAVTGAVQEGSLAATGAGGSGGGVAGSNGGSPHVFQALHYLRRLCSHPLLVVDPAVPAHQKALIKVLGPKIGNNWAEAQEHLRSNLSHSPKLAALRELLIDCGIGTDAAGDKNTKEEALAASDAGHRALVFAQTRALLDLAESSVLQPMGISSLRIDGSVDASERFRRVQRFNADPTVEVMLLTTAVGGLGLNLTAADTVIFLEHDWNPQKDLQAMDRAHRLGQRRAVNVYRLLVRGTLEEQVMSLQKFKLDVAAAVVNAENMSLQAMDTGNLLDLFALQEDDKKKKPGAAGGGGVGDGNAAAAAAAADVGGAGNSGMAAVLAGLTDPAAAEAQYGEEFDLEAFKQRL